MSNADKTIAAALAKAIAALCVRNSFLEDLHSGTTPSSKTGDYSDVNVVTPYGEIPWRNLSRISDAEMKKLMKEIVNKIYTFLCRQDDKEFLEAFLLLGGRYAARWDETELVNDFVVPAKRTRRKPRSHRLLNGAVPTRCQGWLASGSQKSTSARLGRRPRTSR
jgi:hypothetical protein